VGKIDPDDEPDDPNMIAEINSIGGITLRKYVHALTYIAYEPSQFSYEIMM
jgi:hypothetical protein